MMHTTARAAHSGGHVLAVVALAALLTSACAGVPLADPAESPEDCMGAELSGELVKDSRRSGVAVRLMGHTYPLVLPDEYSVDRRDGTVGIVEASGAVVAVEGDVVEAGGGHGSAPEEEFYVCAGTLRRVR